MFGKLVKYEWTAMIRSMLPIYAAVAAISAINAFMFSGFMEGSAALVKESAFWNITQVITMLLYVGVMMILVVFTVTTIIQRFYRGLLKREGYLMFTLPVKTWQLTGSKALVSGLMCMMSFLVAFFSIGCFGGLDFLRGLVQLPGALIRFLTIAMGEDAVMTVHGVILVAELLLMGIVSFLESIYHFYLAMSMGQLSRSHKAAMAVLWYVVLGTAINFINLQYLNHIDTIMNLIGNMGESYILFHLVLWVPLIAILAELAVEFFATNYILDKKLNLE